MAEATTRDGRGNGLLAAGAALAFLAFLATILDAILISALSGSLPASQVSAMQNGIYVGIGGIVLGLILLLAGVRRD
ncbi:MAG: hypothetical protein QXG65_03735 [Thermoplasmata archaeon]